MLIASHHQLGESANELVAKFSRSEYRYGFPDQYAAEFPVRPMYNDQSRIYSGVIGRRYPGAETERYHYLYDPNMYQQPGFGDAAAMSAQQAITVLEGLLTLAPADAFPDFDVVFDGETAHGTGIDGLNKLWIIHGGTFEQVRQAVAAAGGVTATQTPTGSLAKRIADAQVRLPSIVAATLGKVGDIHAAIENMIAVLKSGKAQPVTVTPIAVAAPPRYASPKHFAIAGATIGVVALGVLGAVLLTR